MAGTPSYIIRRTSDLALIARLDAACFPSDERYAYAAVCAWWVATIDGEPVAYAGARPIPGDNCAFLCRAGVLRNHRGNGLQLRLLRARIAWSKRQRHRAVYTYTVPHNVASARNIIAAGLRPWRPSVAWAGHDVCYWALSF